MLNPDRIPTAPLPKAGDAAFALLDVTALLGIVRRRRGLILAVTALFTLLALVFVLTTTPLYTAEADILIDNRSAFQLENGASATNNGASTLLSIGMDTSSVDSQVEILKSERIAGIVLRKLNLVDDPEFRTPGNILGSGLVLARRAVAAVIGPPEVVPVLPGGIPRDVMEEFQDRLEVKRSALTYVLSVSFRARSRERAALIANAMTDAYLTDQLQSKYEATRRASVWLQDRIQEMRAAALTTDRAVQDFKAKNNIVSAGIGPGGTMRLLNEQQLGDMSFQLVNARAATAEAEAKYRRLQAVVNAGDPDAAPADLLNSEVYNDLRQRAITASKRLAEVAPRLGDDHPAVANLRTEEQNIRRLLLAELTRALQGFRSAVDMARAREQTLSNGLAEITGETAVSNTAQVQLRELEREASSNKTIYESFLERYKSALQRESFPVTEARILSEASPPRLKSHPKSLLILILGAIGGLAVGTATALLKEMTDGVFRTPQQLEASLDLPCLGVLPRVTRLRGRSRPRADLSLPPGAKLIPEDIGALRYAVDEPFTRFAETLRAIKVAAGAASTVGEVKILSMVSAVPGEGKSMVAMNLAQLLAHAGKDILLIDADLRSPTLSEIVAPGCLSGLAEVLENKASLSDVLLTDPITGLRVLPALKSANPHTSEIVGSEAMRQLLQHVSGQFDFVIVDLPPLVPIVDVRAVAPAIDAFVFVARAGETPIVTATNALGGASAVGERLIGSVLNDVNLKTLRHQGAASDRTYAATPAYRAYVVD
ncbi:polysaccharide biosynthesis tyrosine autokinase [Methylobacterium gossipiicola]|uniref:non-specific protein-tyrosine kinase n=1 Tax=Methylobacterium gossipiicola TaxID=582675 RepID=A0A1I2RY41_9HYPH|nr:polysaccharide biosynthesis tyrosine autokinase [Methylobacterium gossipiicola]SFG45410.1 succinoglycan biosynthesis transport protein ExoP [Methylobacterium gossipiicola]